MKLKLATTDFAKSAFGFYMWGMLLLMPYNLYPDSLKIVVSDIYFESLAVKSILALLLVSAIGTSLFLMLFGSKTEADGFFKRISFQYLVLPPLKLGQSLCAVAFGLYVAMFCVLLTYEPDHARIWEFPALSFAITMVAFIYWVLSQFALTPSSNNEYQFNPRLAGFILLIFSIATTYFSWITS